MQRHATQFGFSIIEMLVSLAIFSMVVVMAVGTLLVLIAGSQQTQEQSANLSNLSFMLDSMTRDIRTGTEYHCINSASAFASDNQESFNAADCPPPAGSAGEGVSFVESGSSLTSTAGGSATRIAFYYDSADGAIYRRIGDVAAEERLTPSNITVHNAYFYVTGTEDYFNDGDTDQPMVTIFLRVSDESVANCNTAPAEACVELQTTVTQRVLDL